ncbi:MAG: tyrosine-type recombinase/integrase [Proteobacteria bacterium]|nr:tyrosine-type recombinase/integrase [Pseudomonadota bacterium]
MQDKLNFTKKAILDLPIPEKGKRFVFKDEKESGLIVRITGNGVKSFALYKKFKGRPIKITFGTFPDMTVDQARRKAKIEKGNLAGGINANEEKQNFRKEATIKHLFEEYMKRYSKVHKKSWKYDEREIPKFLGHWFNRKLSDINKQEILRFHEKIRENNGIYQANRMLERLRAMYNKAIEWGWDGVNPTLGIKKYKEVQRDRFIQPNEMPFFFKALDAEENRTAKDFFNILLLTGARKSNVLAMKWQDIDFHQKIWRIPETKNGEPVTIPLVQDSLDILEIRKEYSVGCWVFPSQVNITEHFADPKKSWDRIRQYATILLWESDDHLTEFLEEAKQSMSNYVNGITGVYRSIKELAEERNIELPKGLVDIRIHDIRRTFGSYQAITGSSLQVIGKSLGHKSIDATQIYARLHDAPVRASMEIAVQAMKSFKKVDV